MTEGELLEETVCRDFRHTAEDGKFDRNHEIYLGEIMEEKNFVANANQFFECYEELEFKGLTEQFVGSDV